MVYDKLKHATRLTKQRYSRLIARFEEQFKYLIFGDKHTCQTSACGCSESSSKGLERANDNILSIIMQLQLIGENGNAVNDEEMIKCLSYLTETIKNMTLHMNDNPVGACIHRILLTFICCSLSEIKRDTKK